MTLSSFTNLCKKYRTSLLLSGILALLSVILYTICSLPAQDLLLPRYCTLRHFPLLALISIALMLLSRRVLSLFLFVGYHAGVLAGAFLSGPEEAALANGLEIAKLVFLIFVILGFWGEIFSTFPKLLTYLAQWRPIRALHR